MTEILTIDTEMETERQRANELAEEMQRQALVTPAIIDRYKAELVNLPFFDLVEAARQFYPNYNALPSDERETIVLDILEAAFTEREMENWRTAHIRAELREIPY